MSFSLKCKQLSVAAYKLNSFANKWAVARFMDLPVLSLRSKVPQRNQFEIQFLG